VAQPAINATPATAGQGRRVGGVREDVADGEAENAAEDAADEAPKVATAGGGAEAPRSRRGRRDV
jgi:hypothetical protein